MCLEHATILSISKAWDLKPPQTLDFFGKPFEYYWR